MKKWKSLENNNVMGMEIEIVGLTKAYNKQVALSIEKLSIKKGELIGLIGNNGAGKTTILRLLIDLIKADSGIVYYRGINISKTESWKLYTSAYIDSNFLISFFTPEEYFQFIASNYGISSMELTDTLSLFNDFMNGEILGKRKHIRNFSIGNQQKIGIIGAIISKPEILLLDEPFNFLDPTSQYFISNYLVELNKQQHTTIIVSSHNLQLVNDISSRIVLMDKGFIIKDIQCINQKEKDEINSFFKITQAKV